MNVNARLLRLSEGIFRMLMILAVLLWSGGIARPRPTAAETVTVRAIADIWLSDAGEFDRGTSAGLHDRFKLKSVQEMAAIRFDLSALRGRRIESARLEIRHWKSTPEQIIDAARRGWGRNSTLPIRFLRVSTVGSQWSEGTASSPYSDGNGASWLYSDHQSRRPWSWPGSTFADVIMGAGHTLLTAGEVEDRGDGWIGLELPTELISALVCGASDGLAVMEGGTPALKNHFFHSAQSQGSEPQLVVEFAGSAAGSIGTPSTPRLEGASAPDRAKLDSGALRLSMASDPPGFCYEILLDGRSLPRWRIPWPDAGRMELVLDGLEAGARHILTVRAQAADGNLSPPDSIQIRASLAKPTAPQIPAAHAPTSSLPPLKIPAAWALPAWAKPSPLSGRELPTGSHNTKHRPAEEDTRRANALWDGRRVRLTGLRGEYLSFQLCIDAGATDLGTDGPGPRRCRIELPPPQRDDGVPFPNDSVELWRCWYAQNQDEHWQPAYLLPSHTGVEFPLFHPARIIQGQRYQSLVVDVYVPKDAVPGAYKSVLTLQLSSERDIASDIGAVVPIELAIPVEIEVYDPVLPDRLSFWVELNAYRVPTSLLEYHRLAHQNRLVFNPWVITAALTGEGGDRNVAWSSYDEVVAPLLDGSAFALNRRAGIPVECMYLPFYDSWPTELDHQSYAYPVEWPVKGDDRQRVIEHYERGPLIEDGLSDDYRAAFTAVQSQFVEHFAARRWDRTEMQCFFGSKAFHRIRYHRNVWWTTDEPVHWDDWRALGWFDRLWTEELSPDQRHRWVARADISRPEWQAGALGDAAQVIYYGGMDNPADFHRMRELAKELDVRVRIYGEANPDNRNNVESLAWVLSSYLEGAQGVLPWQSLGGPRALEHNDGGTFGGGNALLADGTSLGFSVIGDLRLRALRDGQQLVELLELVGKKHGLDREQLADLVASGIDLELTGAASARPELVEALRYRQLPAWRVEALRRGLLGLLSPAP